MIRILWHQLRGHFVLPPSNWAPTSGRYCNDCGAWL
jgi:hypothetical protein